MKIYFKHPTKATPESLRAAERKRKTTATDTIAQKMEAISNDVGEEVTKGMENVDLYQLILPQSIRKEMVPFLSELLTGLGTVAIIRRRLKHGHVDPVWTLDIITHTKLLPDVVHILTYYTKALHQIREKLTQEQVNKNKYFRKQNRAKGITNIRIPRAEPVVQQKMNKLIDYLEGSILEWLPLSYHTVNLYAHVLTEVRANPHVAGFKGKTNNQLKKDYLLCLPSIEYKKK